MVSNVSDHETCVENRNVKEKKKMRAISFDCAL